LLLKDILPLLLPGLFRSLTAVRCPVPGRFQQYLKEFRRGAEGLRLSCFYYNR